ncbi:protein translation factor SUI1-like protein [Cotonvirus japonicus]|uniref:Protein translation factor SUI1-like protein n=1 Tax=Cotonvirus japonicus TaxID=2811091 RepID=A0ABM7NSD5_9VIRU|nr:protein translation factor SUI1-like protein [Cotonvirus japonicus]BCS83075.1 protein translation factor SUI1-like protein [Cotonvirus japonicus]
MLNRVIYDPMADILNDNIVHSEKTHIKMKQRTKRQFITIIENLPKDLDKKLFLKTMKHTLHCSGSIQTNEDTVFVQLSGDHRDTVKEFLIKNSIVKNDNIIMHGY